MTSPKAQLPESVREIFKAWGKKGGLRGSRADKAKAGKLGAAALRQKLIDEAKAQEQPQPGNNEQSNNSEQQQPQQESDNPA